MKGSELRTQENLAAALDLDQTTVSKWIRGKTAVTLNRLAEIEQLCGLNPGQILVWAGVISAEAAPRSALEEDVLEAVADKIGLQLPAGYAAVRGPGNIDIVIQRGAQPVAAVEVKTTRSGGSQEAMAAAQAQSYAKQIGARAGFVVFMHLPTGDVVVGDLHAATGLDAEVRAALEGLQPAGAVDELALAAEGDQEAGREAPTAPRRNRPSPEPNE